MMKNAIIFVLCLVANSSFAQTVESRENSKGTETRQEKARSKAEEVSQTYSVGKVLFPVFSSMEAQRRPEVQGTPLSGCKVFDSTKFVWTRGMVKQSTVPTVAVQGVNLSYQEITESIAPTAVIGLNDAQGDLMLQANYGLSSPVQPIDAFKCLIGYAAVSEYVLASMLNEGRKVKTRDDSNVIAVPGLQGRAEVLAIEALRSEKAKDSFNRQWREFRLVNGCMVPTPSGLGSNSAVKCGSFVYDQSAKSLLRDGMVLLSADTINGVKISFVSSDGARSSAAETATEKREKKRGAKVVAP
jgi:hypothetical protein